MSEAFSGLPRSASSYVLGQAEGRDDDIIIRPVPEGFRTWLPAFFVVAGALFLALLIAKSGKLSASTGKDAAASAATSADANHGASPIKFIRIPMTEIGPVGIRTGFSDLTIVGGAPDLRVILEKNKSAIEKVANADLTDTTVSDEDTPDGLDAVRERLRADLNEAIGSGVVEQVYLSERPEHKR